MNFEDKLLDFVKRTGQNLGVTERWREKYPQDGFHEVTHLVNSLLGLVVLPTEKILGDIDQAMVEPAGIHEWGATFHLEGETPPTDLHGFLYGLRNAVSHYDIEYKTDDAANITGVIFQVRPWRRHGRPPDPPWDATFTLTELLAFLKRLAHEVEKGL